MTVNLMCPVCRESLTLQDKTWQCSNRHSYDQAKQGYVNLHVVQHKHSKSPGDTPEAVAARRRFLTAGCYQSLQHKIVAVLQQLNIQSAIDIGCGEGYYTQAMAEVVPDLIAVDIAKSAVQIAAKQDTQKQVVWVVGTGAILPVQDQSLQLCSSFFSPLPKTEMLRVLESQGYLLVATPAPQHLYAMREALFDQVKVHEPEKFITQLQPEFELIEQHLITDDLSLNQQQLKDLIAMTPYAWKAKADKRAALEARDQFKIQAQFCLYLFKKQSDESNFD
ncbi:putative RNA methyltransferase [Acinetobacter populi]|jgi:23S rRNA (guanine745-N1)-methyltransferase|uniref:putative RNA methyltransferase n=1 Tax=Acinetobacter populi TaxID=1582270 RepID=UPI003B58F312